MIETFVTLAALGWAAISWFRNQRAVALASASLAGVVGLGWLADVTQFSPWMEGGFGMHVLTLLGGYTVGTAVAARVTRRSAPRTAAFIGLIAMTIVSAVMFQHAMSVVAEAVKNAPGDVAQEILIAGRAEAMRLVQLGGLLGVITTLLLVLPRRRGPVEQLKSGLREGAPDRTGLTPRSRCVSELHRRVVNDLPRRA